MQMRLDDGKFSLGKAGCFFRWRVVCGIVQDEFADARHIPKANTFEFTSHAQKFSAHLSQLVEIVKRSLFNSEVSSHVFRSAEFWNDTAEIARLNWLRCKNRLHT